MQTIEWGLDEHYGRLMQAAEDYLAAARSAGNTTLTAEAAAGATQLSVVSVANFAMGDIIRVGDGATAEVHQVDSVDGGALQITVTRALRSTQAAGATVKGALQDAKGIVRGDREEAAKIQPPLLWLMEGVDRVEPSGGASTIHNFEVIVAALVASTDPAAGRKDAANLAARAYNVLMLDRKWKETAHQVLPTRFEPAQRMSGSRNAFWAAVIFTAQVRRRD